jgi:hypothetical protein
MHTTDQNMETEMKRFLTTVALVSLLASPALAQSRGSNSYSPYNPAHADTSDPGSAPLMHDRAPRAFSRDAAALANTSDPESAPLMTDPPVRYHGRPNDVPGLADTSDPESVHVFRNSR